MLTGIAESSTATQNFDGSGHSDWSQDLDDVLSSISPQKTTAAGYHKDKSKTPRFRVKWRADIIVNDQNTHHGFINDISTLGASIYFNRSFHPEKPRLHIHVPPLNSTDKLHVIEISGRAIYLVYDGEKQLFRTAINFLKFQHESDRVFLEERLTNHHIKIPDLSFSYS